MGGVTPTSDDASFSMRCVWRPEQWISPSQRMTFGHWFGQRFLRCEVILPFVMKNSLVERALRQYQSPHALAFIEGHDLLLIKLPEGSGVLVWPDLRTGAWELLCPLDSELWEGRALSALLCSPRLRPSVQFPAVVQ